MTPRRHHWPKTKNLSLTAILFLSFAVTMTSHSFAAPPQTRSRKIVSQDFTKSRPPATSTPPQVSGTPQKPLAKRQKKPRNNRTYRLTASTAKKSKPIELLSSTQLGITFWRLRPKGPVDTGATLLVTENGTTTAWVAERVESDTAFQKNDLIRLSVESPRSGYLYIIDREVNADGTMGEAELIYPWLDMHRGHNFVRPGEIVDIPAQEDERNFFRADRSNNQVAELLTIIVTPTPLDLPISDNAIPISIAQMNKWQKLWTADTERFELEGGVGEMWTTQEQQAGARVRTRKLTRDDPPPQTIFRVAAAYKKAYLVNVRMNYAR